MNARKRIKKDHEKSVINDFISWLNAQDGTSWTVSEWADPPDAIIKNGNETSWVEHTDLFPSEEVARSIMTYLTHGETHITHSNAPILEPDRTTAEAFMCLLKQKLSKQSYSDAYDQYGQGYLVISEQDPFFQNDTINEIHQTLNEEHIIEDKGYFRNVYLAERRSTELHSTKYTLLKRQVKSEKNQPER